MKLILENLTKAFGSGTKNASKEVIAVNDVSLEIPDGKLVSLLGPSGCGKSTTLFMIAGLESPTSGKIRFDATDVTDVPAEKRGIGLVFQNYALYPHLTVAENIAFPLENFKKDKKLSKEEIEEKVLKVAKIVQIQDYLDRKPKALSGGQQQRVAIARALVKNPPVLLLDEPLSNLDARLRLQTREELRRIQKNTGVTTVFVTHDQDEAMSISDLIVVMKDGIIQQVGAPQEVYDNPQNLFVAKFLGNPPINTFKGEIREGRLFIGEEYLMDVKDLNDQKVTVGIRAEGFEISTYIDSPFSGKKITFDIDRVETMGRDTSMLLSHSLSENTVVRAFLSEKKLPEKGTIQLSVKKDKMFVFDADGKRLV